MKKSYWRLLGLLAAVLVAFTARGQFIHYVLYGKEARENGGLSSGDSTIVYFDRQGDMYPSAASGVAVDDERLEDHYGTLHYYFQYPDGGQSDAEQKRQVRALGRYYGVPLEMPAREDSVRPCWQQLQDSVQARTARDFRKYLKDNSVDALVILVHGFNNAVGEVEWYAPLRRQILDSYSIGKKVHFLHVYWDGRSVNPLFSLWGWRYAQSSLYQVGLGLRQLLARLDPHLPTYAIGHSTGAPILCAALWNCTSALEDSTDFFLRPGELYVDMLGLPRYTTPTFSNLRLAFIAPAMPARHFEDFRDRTTDHGRETLDPPPAGLQRLVIAQNPDDLVTGKMMFSPRIGGATHLGVIPEEYCGYPLSEEQEEGINSGYGVVPFLRDAHSNTETYLYVFEGGNKIGLGHSVDCFRNMPKSFSRFLSTWLTNKAVEKDCKCKH